MGGAGGDICEDGNDGVGGDSVGCRDAGACGDAGVGGDDATCGDGDAGGDAFDCLLFLPFQAIFSRGSSGRSACSFADLVALLVIGHWLLGT